MRQYLAYMFLVLAIASCGSKEEKKQRTIPEGVLSKDSMAYHLSKVHIIDAAMRHRDVRKQSLQAQAKHAFLVYFDTSGITQDQFERSMEFWSEDFEDMGEVYDLAMERLETDLARPKKHQKESEVEDSNEDVEEAPEGSAEKSTAVPPSKELEKKVQKKAPLPRKPIRHRPKESK